MLLQHDHSQGVHDISTTQVFLSQALTSGKGIFSRLSGALSTQSSLIVPELQGPVRALANAITPSWSKWML